MKHARLSKAEYKSLAAFRYSLRVFLRFSEVEVHKAGLTPQQYQALLAIKGFPGREWVTITELSERVQLLHQSVVGLVMRLTQARLIAKHHDSSDRRFVRLTLTPKGEAILERLAVAHQKQLRRLSPKLLKAIGDIQHKG